MISNKLITLLYLRYHIRTVFNSTILHTEANPYNAFLNEVNLFNLLILVVYYFIIVVIVKSPWKKSLANIIDELVINASFRCFCEIKESTKAWNNVLEQVVHCYCLLNSHWNRWRKSWVNISIFIIRPVVFEVFFDKFT